MTIRANIITLLASAAIVCGIILAGGSLTEFAADMSNRIALLLSFANGGMQW